MCKGTMGDVRWQGKTNQMLSAFSWEWIFDPAKSPYKKYKEMDLLSLVWRQLSFETSLMV